MTQASTPGPLSVLAFHCESARLVPLLRKEAERLGKGVPTDLPGLHKDIWTAAEIIEQAEEAFAFTQKMDALAPTASVEASGSGWEQVKIEIEKAFSEGITPQEIIALFRPQPSGETREAVARIIHRNEFEGQAWEDATEAYRQHVLKTASDILSARPLASAGQQGDSAALVNELREELKIAISPQWHPQLAARVERILAALSTTPARAEAQDEGAAKPCPFCGNEAVISRSERAVTVGCDFNDCPSRECYAAGKLEDEPAVIAAWNARAHPSPPPAADEDRVREEVARVEALIEDLTYAAMPTKPDVVTLCGSTASQVRDDLRAILAALKSTAAKEGEKS